MCNNAKVGFYDKYYTSGFFKDDPRVDKITDKYHANGMVVMDRMMNIIFETNGYYANWDNDGQKIIKTLAKYMKCDHLLIKEIVLAYVDSGFFNKRLFKEYGILTSPIIQKLYFSTCVKANRKSRYIKPEYDIRDENNDFTIKTISDRQGGAMTKLNCEIQGKKQGDKLVQASMTGLSPSNKETSSQDNINQPCPKCSVNLVQGLNTHFYDILEKMDKMTDALNVFLTRTSDAITILGQEMIKVTRLIAKNAESSQKEKEKSKRERKRKSYNKKKKREKRKKEREKKLSLYNLSFQTNLGFADTSQDCSSSHDYEIINSEGNRVIQAISNPVERDNPHQAEIESNRSSDVVENNQGSNDASLYEPLDESTLIDGSLPLDIQSVVDVWNKFNTDRSKRCYQAEIVGETVDNVRLLIENFQSIEDYEIAFKEAAEHPNVFSDGRIVPWQFRSAVKFNSFKYLLSNAESRNTPKVHHFTDRQNGFIKRTFESGELNQLLASDLEKTERLSDKPSHEEIEENFGLYVSSKEDFYKLDNEGRTVAVKNFFKELLKNNLHLKSFFATHYFTDESYVSVREISFGRAKHPYFGWRDKGKRIYHFYHPDEWNKDWDMPFEEGIDFANHKVVSFDYFGDSSNRVSNHRCYSLRRYYDSYDIYYAHKLFGLPNENAIKIIKKRNEMTRKVKKYDPITDIDPYLTDLSETEILPEELPF